MDYARNYTVSLMSIEEFKVGLLEAHRIPGLLIKTEENGCLYIGIQINDKQVLKVATTTVDEVREKVEFWKDKVEEIQKEYQPLIN